MDRWCRAGGSHRDVTFVAVSRAPVEQIEAARRRTGWSARWVSSYDSDFNYDFHVSFRPEDLAAGKVFYNYKCLRVQSRTCQASACSTRTRTATSI